jgi:hypothetical protein
MAAARVGAMGMTELAALVTTRLDLLRSPHRGRPTGIAHWPPS